MPVCSFREENSAITIAQQKIDVPNHTNPMLSYTGTKSVTLSLKLLPNRKGVTLKHTSRYQKLMALALGRWEENLLDCCLQSYEVVYLVIEKLLLGEG